MGDGKTALVTNATGFAGPPAAAALLEAGYRVFVHDRAFADPARFHAFEEGRIGLFPIAAAEPRAIIDAVFDKSARLDAIVSNDHYPAPSAPPERADPKELVENHRALVAFPFALIQSATPRLRAQGGANIVMITSNRDRLPLEGAAFADAARAAANAMTRSLAVDLAKDGIVLNAVAPNFLYSEAYYPEKIYRDSAAGRDYVARSVAVGRLAEPWEIGELIGFLAGMKGRFLTGAVIDFSGGWPFGPPRPSG